MINISLDKTLKTPLHRQLSRCIETAILNGNLRAGELLPSEDQLGRTFNISRTVVRRAFLDLSQLKLIEQRQGQGHFVRLERAYPDLLLNPHRYTQTNDESIQSITILKEILSSNDELISEMGFLENDLVYHIKRIHTHHQEILFTDEWFFKCESALGLSSENLIQTNLDESKLIKESTLEIQCMTIEEALLLDQAKNSPAFILNQVMKTSSGILSAHYKAIIPSSKTELSVKVSVL